jgi:hypothetical protein
MPLILGGIGVLAIAVVAFLMMNGGKKDDDKQGDQQAQTDTNNTGNNTAGNNTAGSNAANANANESGKPAEGDGKPAEKPAEGDGKPAEGSAKPAEGDGKPAEGDAKPAEKPAASSPDAVPMPDVAEGEKKEPWMRQRNPAETMADVKSAGELYGDVQWPESIDAAKKTELQGIAEDLDVNGGIRHIRAKNKLAKEGYPALFAILERLHGLDYRRAEDAAFGFELNKVIEDITGGLNARYSAVQAGEEIHPAKAQWNTKTVKAWMSTFAKWPDEATFTEAKKERAKKNG